MTHPFEDDDRRYLVLVNSQNQHSLWPADIPAPPGWHTAHDEDTRQACLAYVETHWTDLRSTRPRRAEHGPANHDRSMPAPRQFRGRPS